MWFGCGDMMGDGWDQIIPGEPNGENTGCGEGGRNVGAHVGNMLGCFTSTKLTGLGDMGTGMGLVSRERGMWDMG